MKKPLITIFIIVLLAAVAWYVYSIQLIETRVPDASLNPDPNHTHADLAIWIHNTQADFSGDEYMSGTSADETDHDEPHEYKHQHLHLHDNVGHVIHRHKPGLILNDFFRSLNILHAESCLAVQGASYCNTKDAYWQMFVNGVKRPFNPEYVFNDLDQILLTYGGSEQQITQQLASMTDDACIYSKACPWRGEAPAENCVADPEVPCVQVFE